jgi:hypothetical protein
VCVSDVPQAPVDVVVYSHGKHAVVPNGSAMVSSTQGCGRGISGAGAGSRLPGLRLAPEFGV